MNKYIYSFIVFVVYCTFVTKADPIGNGLISGKMGDNLYCQDNFVMRFDKIIIKIE